VLQEGRSDGGPRAVRREKPDLGDDVVSEDVAATRRPEDRAHLLAGGTVARDDDRDGQSGRGQPGCVVPQDF